MRTPRFWPAGGPRPRWAALALTLLALALAVASCGGSGSRGACASQPCIATADGLVLRGKLYGSGSPGVILAHSLGSSQGAYKELAGVLAARGFFVLTFDFRGHGQSPGRRDVGLADADLTAALLFMKQSLDRPKVFLVGASMGGTAALKVAAREVNLGVVTLSAPAVIRGLSAEDDVGRIKTPKLLIASEGDQPAAAAARSLFAQAKDPRQIQVLPGRAHGTDLLKGDQGGPARDLVIKFLEAQR